MYDNINFYLDSCDFEDKDILNEVLCNSDGITIDSQCKTGSTETPFVYISIEGKNKQKLSFKVTPFRLSMIGKNSSICKYYLGDNFQTLTLKQFNDAIEEISNKLGISLDKAKVCRIDFAHNFIMQYLPSTYHSCLLSLSRFKRGDINGNLYFKSTRIELNFYDKKKEYREKGVKIPEKYTTVENILRYEIRFKKNVSTIFGRVITVKDLCSESFFVEVFNKWKDYFFKIYKQNPIIFENQTSTFSTQDFKDYMFVEGVKSIGGIDYVYKMIDESKKAKNISKHKSNYLKTVVKSAFNNSNCTAKNDFVEELNNKMKEHQPPF